MNSVWVGLKVPRRKRAHSNRSRMVYMRTDDILRSVVVLFLVPSSSFLSPVVGSKASATRGEERPFPPPPVIPRSSLPPCSTIRRLTSTSLLAQRRQVKSLVPRARVTVIPPFRYPNIAAQPSIGGANANVRGAFQARAATASKHNRIANM